MRQSKVTSGATDTDKLEYLKAEKTNLNGVSAFGSEVAPGCTLVTSRQAPCDLEMVLLLISQLLILSSLASMACPFFSLWQQNHFTGTCSW